MRYYKTYMKRQEISPEGHEKLMELNTARKAPRRAWARYGALAACAALVLSVGLWKGLGVRMPSASNMTGPGPVSDDVPPVETDEAVQSDENRPEGFTVHSPVEEGVMNFFSMPSINYQDVTHSPEKAASRAMAPGSFLEELTLEDVQKLFWGPEGVPETYQTEIGRQDLPWPLFWDGYTLDGFAWYDGEGQFTELTLYGNRDRSSFTLELRLGALPFSCVVDPDRTVSDAFGTPVTGWSRVYDRDGDNLADYICGSEFMTKNDIGVRFETRNCGDPASENRLDAEAWFNTLLVREVLTSGLHLDHLMYSENVPAWRDVKFDTLEQARQEAAFASYLPTDAPEGYSSYTGVNRDFFGRLSYQEGHENMLFVRWSWEYDTAEVEVYFPEGAYSTTGIVPVDINVPESYDCRLYEVPWWEAVPQEYREGFYDVTFRAEDMSLGAVEARMDATDGGGFSCHFNVLHENGVVVSYYCRNVAAQEVWKMVQDTLA